MEDKQWFEKMMDGAFVRTTPPPPDVQRMLTALGMLQRALHGIAAHNDATLPEGVSLTVSYPDQIVSASLQLIAPSNEDDEEVRDGT